MSTHQARPRRDDGSAMVEFVVLTCLLLLPVVYLVTCLGQVQAAAFATESAARAGAVAVAAAPDAATGEHRRDAQVRTALADQGFTDSAAAHVETSCSVADCQAPQARVDVTVTQPVPLPLPRFLAGAWPLHVTVSATRSATGDRFRP